MKKNPRKVGVLFSGGLDSAALVGYFARRGIEVWPLYVRCGLRWENTEMRFAKSYLEALAFKNVRPMAELHLQLEGAYESNWSKQGKVPDAISNDREVFLPARNLLLCMKAALYLSSKGIGDVALATLKGNPFHDATPKYFHNLGWVLSRSFDHRIRIHTPFRFRSKAEVIATNAGLPLEYSLSCIDPKRLTHCGRCNKCAERQKAFREAGVPDLTHYLTRSKLMKNRKK